MPGDAQDAASCWPEESLSAAAASPRCTAARLQESPACPPEEEEGKIQRRRVLRHLADRSRLPVSIVLQSHDSTLVMLACSHEGCLTAASSACYMLCGCLIIPSWLDFWALLECSKGAISSQQPMRMKMQSASSYNRFHAGISVCVSALSNKRFVCASLALYFGRMQLVSCKHLGRDNPRLPSRTM